MEAPESRGGEERRSVRLFGVSIVRHVVEEEELEEEVEGGEEYGAGEEVLRKSKSMGNLAAVEHGAGEAGYLSDGGLGKPGKRRRGAGAQGHERKKGVPWTEEEHRTFLAGLEKLGKGDWRGISRKFVTTRTPTQVASHAQKYFIRQTMPNNKKRRSSLFDVVINDAVQASTSETASTSPLAKAIPNDIKHLCQDNEKGGTLESSSTQMASKGPVIPPNLQLATSPSGVSGPCLLNNMVGVPGSMEEKQISVESNVCSTPPRTFYLPQPLDLASSNVNAHPTAFNPEFQQLFPCRPPQATAAYPVSKENSDLELSIAPPKALTMSTVAPSEWSWCR